MDDELQTELDLVEVIRADLIAQRAASTAAILAVLNLVNDGEKAQTLARGLHTIATAIVASEASDDLAGLPEEAASLAQDIVSGIIEQAHSMRVEAAEIELGRAILDQRGDAR